MLRKCYEWTLAWAEHPKATWALFFIAVIESSVFPIPPDLLLIALSLGRSEFALRYAAICTLGSTVGALIGYGIGMFLFLAIAMPIIEFYHLVDQFEHVKALFDEWGVWLVLITGFSPIPFKLITITAGALAMPLPLFLIAAVISRGARFYLVGGILYWGGKPVRSFVDKYFEWLTLGITVCVVLGFGIVWYIR
ncbi:MAG: YqaA family protein [Mariprofundaceae bacterium]|nr:YqaA family protein [Mariprofundaceae bacterium]